MRSNIKKRGRVWCFCVLLLLLVLITTKRCELLALASLKEGNTRRFHLCRSTSEETYCLSLCTRSNAAGFGLVCSNRTHERIFSLALCDQSKKKALSICSRFHNQRRLPVLLLTFPFPGNGFDSLFGPAAPESESANHKMTWFFKIKVPPSPPSNIMYVAA